MSLLNSLEEGVVDILLQRVITFEKEIINDKNIGSDSNIIKLKDIIEEEVQNNAD